MNVTVKGRHRDTDLYPPVLASLTVGFHLRTSPPRSAVILQQHRLDQGGGWKSLSSQTPPLHTIPARLDSATRVRR